MKKSKPLFSSITITLVFLLLLASCESGKQKRVKIKNEGSKKQETITVFAASSLTDVLSEIIDSFEVKYHVKVKTNMASSGTLARQIEQGGTPDVYISASERWVNHIDSLGYVISGFKKGIASNELVLIAPLNSLTKATTINGSFDFISLLGNERLSIGNPAHVPAGKYAKQSLEYYGWYSKLKKNTLHSKDARSALMIVEMEEAPVGIVYRTDARKSKKIKILGTFPEVSHKPIVYVAGLCSENILAKDFFVYLNSIETKTTWTKYGFNN